VRVGIVTKWFNRGQAYIARQMRSALHGLGHESFVLARPSRNRGPQPALIERSAEWLQQGLTEASSWAVPASEYLDWAEERRLDAILFDNCFQFAEIAALRESGVRTAGRFIWEFFGPEHVEPARRALDRVYSMTRCEQRRYAEMGIESPLLRWGIHPELLSIEGERDPELVRLYFPGGLMGPRKPRREVVEAFGRSDGAELRLLIKTQVERRRRFLERAAANDSRVEVVIEDMPTDQHRAMFASCDVCLAPSRWEGLGLFLYEAIACGMPIITNDDPPMNEVVIDELNGLLVESHPDGTAPSGITAYRPDVDSLTMAIERMRDPALRRRLERGAGEVREGLSWERTVASLGDLLDELFASA
jgi:1,2-diacylglycerol 3-alpha-glucosyltransferase